MKYGVFAKVNGKVKSHTLAALTNEEEYTSNGWELVTTTKTKAEARKLVNDLGWITLA